MNIHLRKASKRQLFLKAVRDCLDVCGVVESWLQESSNIMDAELYSTEWCWFGKDRKGRRGGGLGFLARKSLKPRTPGPCGNSNILWLEVDCGGRWFIAVVYLIPNEREVENANEQTLSAARHSQVHW